MNEKAGFDPMRPQPIRAEDIQDIEERWANGRFDAAYWMKDIIPALKELDRLRKIEEKARAWLEAVDHHEMLVDQDPNYTGHQTHVLLGILKARESLREALGVKA